MRCVSCVMCGVVCSLFFVGEVCCMVGKTEEETEERGREGRRAR